MCFVDGMDRRITIRIGTDGYTHIYHTKPNIAVDEIGDVSVYDGMPESGQLHGSLSSDAKLDSDSVIAILSAMKADGEAARMISHIPAMSRAVEAIHKAYKGGAHTVHTHSTPFQTLQAL